MLTQKLFRMGVMASALVVGLCANADPVLIISDGVTSSGPITLSGGSGTYSNPSFDGSWADIGIIAESKPAIGSATSPNMQLTILATSLGTGNPLTITIADTGFGPTSGANNAVAQMSGQTFGSGTGDIVTLNTFYDANNNLDALTTPLTASGNLSGNNYSSTATGSLSLTGPYSLSEVVTIGGGSAVGYSLLADLQATNQSSGGTPGLLLVKTASPTNAALGQIVTYSYAITNTGSTTLNDINIVDDNGTPADPTDDFTVNPAPFSLAPGQGTSFSIPHITEPLCTEQVGSSNLSIGTLTVNVLANGNVEVVFNQSEGLNDNRYGTNATAATGWSGGHKFNDLVGSDQADFVFTDGKGNVVLDFLADYISQATSAKFGDGVTITYPSGFGTLGELGGDGKLNSGSASNILSVHTTLSDTINQPGFTGFTVNSPPETSPLSGISKPPGWNYVDGYTVLISSNAFGANGFGGVTIPFVHDSPSKIQGIIKFFPTNVCSCVVNTATATATQGGTVVATASAQATVCFGGSSSGSGGGSTCNLTEGKITIGPAGYQVQIKNNGTAPVVMTEVGLNAWPAANGNLTKITLNGPAAVWQGSVAQPATLTTTDFNATSTATAQRTIGPGQTMNLTLVFQHPAANTPTAYVGGTVEFGTDSSCALSFP